MLSIIKGRIDSNMTEALVSYINKTREVFLVSLLIC